MNITILGAGAWGTALAIKFATRHTVTLWLRDGAKAAELRATRRNQRYLPDDPLPDALHIETDWEAAMATADLVLCVTPTSGLREAARRVGASRPGLPFIWACKGLEAASAKLPHQVVREELPATTPCGALSGPSFAQEVARGLPTAVTLASAHADFAQETARALHSSRFRIYSSQDIVGVEVGGAVKNVMAIATGISDGLALGLNARAALMTRGLAEMARFGQAMGGRLETLMGLSGVGDLILTCTGDLSRNRRVGLQLAQGLGIDAIIADLGHVAEGVYTAREVMRMAQSLQVEMPITEAVCRLIYDGLKAQEAIDMLLAREPRAEGG
jgi:glycerol-3-phosphate dehydrogenase (NAD(P)+)